MLNERGFTLVEVLVALVILSFGVLGISASAAQLAVRASATEQKALAIQAVEDRLAEVRAHPVYGELDSIFTASDDTVAGASRLLRTTTVTRTQVAGSPGRTVDYTTIHVLVYGSTLADTVAGTAVVAIP